MHNPVVTFCIATFNRGRGGGGEGGGVIDCLKKVLANGLPSSHFEIIVIDNASTDGTPDLIATECPSVQLIRLPKNCGPVAKNIAMRRAKGEFIVLLDDDAYPHPGATAQMIRHFREDKHLAAAVFDVTLPDGSKEGSAYPDVFIGAGTGLRKSALDQLAGAGGRRGPLPSHFFMQAEEYDLSFRLLNAGYSIQRLWDSPLTHLKTPNARIGQRTTRLDVRNNLYLLAKYLPDPLAHQFAADWLARYFLMARQRDAMQPPHAVASQYGTHKKAFLQGAAQGLANWSAQRADGRHLLTSETLERIFKFQQIRDRLARAAHRLNARSILFADLGKNLLAYHHAAQSLGLQVLAVADDNLGPSPTQPAREYRGIPLLTWTGVRESSLLNSTDMIVITNMSPAHAPKRAAALRRVLNTPVVDLFSRQDQLLHGTPISAPALATL